jgi:hypothetical protein
MTRPFLDFLCGIVLGAWISSELNSYARRRKFRHSFTGKIIITDDRGRVMTELKYNNLRELDIASETVKRSLAARPEVCMKQGNDL